jgi:2-oxoglutarate ferredoxin oxidoreductase subunit gamma
MKIEIRLSGSGGQGIITAGIILAEAALLDGKNAVQGQSYGPESRGGSSKAEVIVSTESIDYPKVVVPDVLLALTDAAYAAYGSRVHEHGVVLLDAHLKSVVEANNGFRVYRAPITELAREELKPVVANVVALGVLNEVYPIVSRESLERAVLDRAPRGTEALNRRALELGHEFAQRELSAAR